jgi:DNA-binding GntR family transcriptional regulator
MFSDQVHCARLLTLHMRPAPHEFNRDHRAPVEAIARGDAEETRRLHREHRVMACELIISLLNKHGFSQV